MKIIIKNGCRILSQNTIRTKLLNNNVNQLKSMSKLKSTLYKIKNKILMKNKIPRIIINKKIMHGIPNRDHFL